MSPDTVFSYVFSPREQDPHFRSVLTSVLHTGLRQLGIIGLVASLLYVGLSVFGLGYELAWTYETIVRGGTGQQIVIAGLLVVAALSVIGLLLAQRRCALRTGRLFGWGAVLLATAVATFEGALRGVFSTEYVILAYLLIVAIIPFRPVQVIGVGSSIALVVYLLGPSGAAWTGALSFSAGMPEHLLFIGGGAVLVTGASVALYFRHHSFGTARARLQRSRNRLQRTQEVAQVGGWEYDPATDTVQGTAKLYDLLDLTDDPRFALNQWLQFFPPPSRPEVRAAIEESLETDDSFDLEVSLTTASDRHRTVRLRGTPQHREGHPIRLTGTVQDITHQEAMAQRIHEQERLLRSITENVSDGIYRLVPGDGLVYVNRAFARLFGYDNTADVLKLDPDAFHAHPNQQSDPLHLSVPPNQSEKQATFRRKDGSTFVGLLGGTVVRNEEGEIQYVDGVVTDITDLKEREKILKGERDRFETLFETLLRNDDTASGP